MKNRALIIAAPIIALAFYGAIKQKRLVPTRPESDKIVPEAALTLDFEYENHRHFYVEADIFGNVNYLNPKNGSERKAIEAQATDVMSLQEAQTAAENHAAEVLHLAQKLEDFGLAKLDRPEEPFSMEDLGTLLRQCESCIETTKITDKIVKSNNALLMYSAQSGGQPSWGLKRWVGRLTQEKERLTHSINIAKHTGYEAIIIQGVGKNLAKFSNKAGQEVIGQKLEENRYEHN
ncbi:hypothetical protein N9Z27_02180 [Alphaproteobacteria bacterium]|nr:hypothetical protein [Alphaproteobacteria bacterium]